MIKEDIDIFEKFMKDRHVRGDISHNFSGKRGCSGGIERLYITTYGDVLTCPLVHISYGNIFEEPLEVIYKRVSSMPFIKKYSNLCKQAFDKEYYEKICKPEEQLHKAPLSIFNHPIAKEKEVSRILENS